MRENNNNNCKWRQGISNSLAAGCALACNEQQYYRKSSDELCKVKNLRCSFTPDGQRCVALYCAAARRRAMPCVVLRVVN